MVMNSSSVKLVYLISFMDMCTPLHDALMVCALSAVFRALGWRCFSASWWVQKLQDVAERSWGRFRIRTTVSIKEKTRLRGKLSQASLLLGQCRSAPEVLEVSLDEFEITEVVLCVCVLKQGMCLCIFKQCVVLFGVLFREESFVVRSGWAREHIR